MVTSLRGLADAIDEPTPFDAGLVFAQLIDAIVQVQQRQHFAVDAGSPKGVGNRVDAFDIVHRDHPPHRHVGVHRNLLAHFFLHRIGSPAGDDVRHDARLPSAA